MIHQALSQTDAVPDLKVWCVDHALPFWAANGIDRKGGGFHERLFHNGSPDHRAIRRLRVQARQIYVYAHAADAGWFPDGLSIALNGFDYLMDKGHAPDGAPGFVHLLTPEGGIENPLRDTYDHMFVLLAAAWLARASGDAQVRAVVDETLGFIDAHLTDASGFLLEGLPASLPRRQNPNMHGFEAMLALHETLDYPGAWARGERFFSLMMDRFLDAESGMIREFFNDDWTPFAGPEGDSVEPGHMAEWAWLLRKFARFGGAIPEVLPTQLLARACHFSDRETGLLCDEGDRAGQVRRHTQRMWPQTELLKARLAETEFGIAGAKAQAWRAATALHQHYLTGIPAGGWIDQRDANGAVISTHMPSSTFYHAFVAAFEAERVLNAGAATLREAS